jgi:hypothetical protein
LALDRKLGRRPPKNAPALMFDCFRGAGIIPVPPAAIDNFSKVTGPWVLGGNDKYGTCGPTSVANLLLLITKMMTGIGVTVTDEDVFDLYRRSGNPNFDPITDIDDNGVDMQTMLEALLKGGIAGHTPLAFVKLNHNSMDEIRDGIQIFGGLLFGVDLEIAQQSQTVWDYKKSPAWGGHAILSGTYKTAPDLTDCITWAEMVGMTDAFLEYPGYQLSEVWGVIWPETLKNLNQDQYNAMAAEYKALTGRDFPVPFRPIPDPGPTPGPTPGPVPPPAPSPVVDPNDQTLAVAAKKFVALRHSGQNKVMATALKVWLKAKGL